MAGLVRKGDGDLCGKTEAAEALRDGGGCGWRECVPDLVAGGDEVVREEGDNCMG